MAKNWSDTDQITDLTGRQITITSVQQDDIICLYLPKPFKICFMIWQHYDY